MTKGSESFSNRAYAYLLDQLFRNELVPGDSVNRRDIARELDVSVAPVLEAMLRLEAEGYLESVPRKGTKVKPVRQEDIKGQLIVREALECAAARLFCGKPVQENYEELARIAGRLDAFNDESYDRWEAEIEFHQRLVHLCDVDALIREFDRNFRLNTFYRINRVYGLQRGHVVNSHLKLLDKLLTEDAAAAEQAIRDHTRAGKDELFA